LRERTSDDAKIEWTFENISPKSRENNMPPFWCASDFIAVSSGDWNKYCSTLNEKLISASKDSKKSDAMIASIFGGGEKLSPLEKCRLIRNYAAKMIKNAGPNFFELPEKCIGKADDIFSGGYGNSADRAVALAALLNAAGIQYDFIFSSSQFPFLDDIIAPFKNCPQSFFLDSVLVRARIDDRKFFLNDSDQYAQIGATASDGKIAFAPSKEGFFKITPDEEFKTKISSLFLIKLEDDGSADIRISETFSGMAFAAMKKTLEELTPENLRRLYEEKASELSHSAVISGTPLKNFDAYPGKFEMSLKIPNFANFANNRIYFSLPERPRALASAQFSRENPFFLTEIMKTKNTFVILPPPAYETVEIMPPIEKEFSFPCGLRLKISSQFAEKNNSVDFAKDKKYLLVEEELDFAPGIFYEEEYRKLLNETGMFNSKNNSIVIFKRQ
jgi:hypothetical protein